MAVEISANSADFTRSLKSADNSLKGFTGAVSKVATAATVALGAISFAALGREIIQITAEFQKFEAVLTNTLGSNSEAKEALENIREFAAQTPFSVQELTASFVKLANQGFKPTTDEMRKLGDLAASTGKGFDQLAEAIIDAQTGEFERLKEFGIRASKSGDQVKFSFKGVETQTKFTGDSIREYLLSLGDLEGVQGSTAAISATLGGKISNLGDSFDSLLLTLGNLTSGPLAGFVDLLGEALASIQDILTEDKQFTVIDTVNDQYVESAKTIDDVNKNLEKLIRLKKIEGQAYDDATTKLGDANNQLSLSTEEFFKLGKEQSTAKTYVDAYGAAIEALTKKQDEFNKKQETALKSGIIKDLQDRIKVFEDLKIKAFSVDAIGEFNNKIKELRDELDLLNATGSESNFLKNLNKNQTLGIETEIKTPTSDLPENFGLPTTLDIDVQPYLDKLEQTHQAQDAFGKGEAELTEQAIARQQALEAQQEKTNATALAFGDVVGDAFGRAAAGQITFKQALKQTTQEILKMFLQRALAGVVAGAAGTTAPPPVILALAAAGMAGVLALFSSFGGPSSGSRGGGGSNIPRANVSRITPTAREESGVQQVEFTIHGDDLKAISDRQNKRGERLKG
jgi:tRNA(Ser,Leu) C12 N-acetylase TAN1